MKILKHFAIILIKRIQHKKLNIYYLGASYRRLKKWLVTITKKLETPMIASRKNGFIVSTSPFEYAIKNNNIPVVKQLLSSLQASKNIFDPHLINFITSNSSSLVRKFHLFIIYNIAEVIEKGDLKLVKYFITVFRDDITYQSLCYAITAAVKYGKTDILLYLYDLCKQRNDIYNLAGFFNHAKSNENALVIAVANQDIEAVKILLQCKYLEAGAGENEQNTVYQAIKNNDIQLLHELVTHGADLNKINYSIKKTIKVNKYTAVTHAYDISPLEYAFLHSNFNTLKWLIEHGAKHICNDASCDKLHFTSTPLYSAILNNNEKFVKLLLTTKVSDPTKIAITEEIDRLNAIEYAESLNCTR